MVTDVSPSINGKNLIRGHSEWMENNGNGRVWVWVSGGWECMVIGRGGKWPGMDENGSESHPFPSWDWMGMAGNVRMRFFPLSYIQSPFETEKNITLYQAA